VIGQLPNGELIVTSRIIAPEVVELRGEYVLYNQLRCIQREPATSMFVDFFNLADGTPQQVFDYAKKWGAIAIPKTTLRIPGNRPEDSLFLAPIAAWRDLSLRFCSIQNIAAALESRKKGTPEDWRPILRPHNAVVTNVADARRYLSHAIRDLVVEAGLYPLLEWDQDTKRWQLEFNCGIPFSNLLAILTLHLMLAVADTSWAICSYCNKPYPLGERRPPEGQTHCCGRKDCITKRWREYKRRKRQRE
jgi:hypothetical protein